MSTTQDATDARESVEQFQEKFARLKQEIGKEIVGYEDVVEKVLICLFSSGHVLLEGVPDSARPRWYARWQRRSTSSSRASSSART